MKIFLDENLPKSLVIELNALGFETNHVIDAGMKGNEDSKIASFAKNTKSILVTKDLEFGSFILYPKGSHYSLIILRVPNILTKQELGRILINFLQSVEHNTLIGKMVILEVGKYRIRDIS